MALWATMSGEEPACSERQSTGDDVEIECEWNPSSAMGDRATFASQLSQIIRTARMSGVSVDGRWTIPPYEVVISGQQVTILSARESGIRTDE